ncbi:MAG: class I SAM-dependent methyltransferase [Flavobacteriales bacterium]|nr:class I SAM-dependent methyltransferase [Flavobacteriales bacterium]MBK7248368.1 class I SAM-dependent methyltransferase [Flavobacteriales bacterium]
MPQFLEGSIDPTSLGKRFDRYDEQRLDYFTRKLDFRGKKILDIGANTGYFTFESIERGAQEVVSYEGSANHAEFLRLSAETFRKNVKVRKEMLDFNTPIPDAPFDIVLLLNVLHHVGDDFGEPLPNVAAAQRKIIENLNWFAEKTEYLIFQIGFSWMTDYSKPLFANGTKAEMIAMITDGIKGFWDVVEIGIAEEIGGQTRYQVVNESNIARNDALGEFRNRPVFILRSLKERG